MLDELSKKINEVLKTQKYDANLVATLVAISATSKLLAEKIFAMKDKK